MDAAAAVTDAAALEALMSLPEAREHTGGGNRRGALPVRQQRGEESFDGARSDPNASWQPS